MPPSSLFEFRKVSHTISGSGNGRKKRRMNKSSAHSYALLFTYTTLKVMFAAGIATADSKKVARVKVQRREATRAIMLTEAC